MYPIGSIVKHLDACSCLLQIDVDEPMAICAGLAPSRPTRTAKHKKKAGSLTKGPAFNFPGLPDGSLGLCDLDQCITERRRCGPGLFLREPPE